MRSIWKGAISFGLVTIPVRLYSATEEHDVSFHQVHRSDGGRIRYQRICAIDGTVVSYSDIAKGYELPNGELVVLDEDDFAELPLPTARSIDVLTFVPLDQVDPIFFSRTYYLEPERTGLKPYVLLREALQRSGRVGIVKVALRARESLAALRIRDGVFVLETMLWPDEVRAPVFPFTSEEVELRPQELAMANSLIDTLSGDFAPEQYSDDYRTALQRLIDAKIAGRQVVTPAESSQPAGSVLDLMAALRESVDAARRAQQPAPRRRPAKGAATGPAKRSGKVAAKSPQKRANTRKSA